jgi:hypothetical protein
MGGGGVPRLWVRLVGLRLRLWQCFDCDCVSGADSVLELKPFWKKCMAKQLLLAV